MYAEQWRREGKKTNHGAGGIKRTDRRRSLTPEEEAVEPTKYSEQSFNLFIQGFCPSRLLCLSVHTWQQLSVTRRD